MFVKWNLSPALPACQVCAGEPSRVSGLPPHGGGGASASEHLPIPGRVSGPQPMRFPSIVPPFIFSLSFPSFLLPSLLSFSPCPSLSSLIPSRPTYRAMRTSIIDMVLATDMSQHFEHLTKFKVSFTVNTVSVMNAHVLPCVQEDTLQFVSPPPASRGSWGGFSHQFGQGRRGGSCGHEEDHCQVC